MNVPCELVKLTHEVNQASLRVNGRPDTCILSSYALNFVLTLRSIESKVMRVTLALFPNDGSHAVVLGSDGEGQRMTKAGNGMWRGHLAVLVNDRWLLDPTADQANRNGINIPPMAIEMKSLDPWKCTQFAINGCSGRYNIYRGKQAGFKWAGDARPSHWMPVVYEMIPKRNI